MSKILANVDEGTDVERVLRAPGLPAVHSLAEKMLGVDDRIFDRTEEANNDLLIRLFGNPRNSHRKPERTRISRRHL